MPPDAARESDEDLVRRARAGDEVAERALLQRHLPRLRGLVGKRLRGILRGRVGASDVMQEAWLTVHQRLAEFEDRGQGSFGRWLAQILDHKIRDELRRHLGSAKRDVRREQAPCDDTPAPARQPTASSQAMRREERERLDAALGTLSDGQRLVLRMAHYDGLTISEIARRLGKPPDTVYKLYGRALEALTQRLSAQGDGGR